MTFNMQECYDCNCYHPFADEPQGFCRLMPPVPAPNGANLLPTVKANFNCAQWRAREKVFTPEPKKGKVGQK